MFQYESVIVLNIMLSDAALARDNQISDSQIIGVTQLAERYSIAASYI